MAASISKNNDKAKVVVCAVAGSFGFSQLYPEQEYTIVSFVGGCTRPVEGAACKGPAGCM